MYPDWSFGDRVRKARTTVGMTQEEFATAIGVGESSLAAWETDRAMPRSRQIVDVCKRIEAVTNIPHLWLLGAEEPTPTPPPATGAFPAARPPVVRHLRKVTETHVEPEVTDEALAYVRLADNDPFQGPPRPLRTVPSKHNQANEYPTDKPVGQSSDALLAA